MLSQNTDAVQAEASSEPPSSIQHAKHPRTESSAGVGGGFSGSLRGDEQDHLVSCQSEADGEVTELLQGNSEIELELESLSQSSSKKQKRRVEELNRDVAALQLALYQKIAALQDEFAKKKKEILAQNGSLSQKDQDDFVEARNKLIHKKNLNLLRVHRLIYSFL